MSLLALHALLAVTWFMLGESPDPSRLAFGVILGFALIAIFRPVFDLIGESGPENTKPGSDYVRRVFSFFIFSVWFLKEFLVANVKVALTVLTKPKSKIHPHIFKVDVSDLKTLEIVFMAQCITLTPGTTSVLVSESQKTLYVHALDAAEVTREKQLIETGLKQKILRFFR